MPILVLNSFLENSRVVHMVKIEWTTVHLCIQNTLSLTSLILQTVLNLPLSGRILIANC